MKKLLAVVVVLLFALINYRGAKETGRAGNVVTVLKILIILLFVVLGSKIILLDRQPPRFDNFLPFFPHGFLGILTAMGLTYIAFEGYEIIAQSGEEIKNPQRNIPRAIFYSLLIVVPIYLLVSFVALGVVHPQGVTAWDYLAEKKEIAMVEAARSISAWGAALLLIGGLLSTISALNATIYSSSRVSFAMGRDHNLPEVFSRVHPRHKTPSGSLLISSTLIIVILLLLPIEDIASSADVMFLLLFIFVNVALIHIRSKHPGRLKGYRSPLFPLIPVLGIITQGMLIVVMFIYSPKSFFTSMLWIGAGLSIYYAYSRFKEKEEVGPEVVLQEKELAHKKFKLVLGVEEEREIRPLMNIAIPIAREKDAEIFVVHVISLPPQTPLHVGKELIEERRALLESADRIGEQHDIPVSFTLRVSHRTYQGILDSVIESKGNLLLLGSGKIGPRRRLLGSILDPLLQEVPCDVGILKVQDGSKVKKILVPAAGGPNAELAFELGWSIVKQNGGKLTLLNIIHNEAKRGKGEEILKRIRKGRRQGKGKIEEKVVLGSDVLQTILEESERHDLILMGASRLGLWKRVRFGTVPEKLMRVSPVPVLFIRKYEGRILSWLRRFIAG